MRFKRLDLRKQAKTDDEFAKAFRKAVRKVRKEYGVKLIGIRKMH